jgi:hypothetical protein
MKIAIARYSFYSKFDAQFESEIRSDTQKIFEKKTLKYKKQSDRV